jgi:hypothetical protein
MLSVIYAQCHKEALNADCCIAECHYTYCRSPVGGELTRTIFTAVINNVSALVTLLRVINFQARKATYKSPLK